MALEKLQEEWGGRGVGDVVKKPRVCQPPSLALSFGVSMLFVENALWHGALTHWR